MSNSMDTDKFSNRRHLGEKTNREEENTVELFAKGGMYQFLSASFSKLLKLEYIEDGTAVLLLHGFVTTFAKSFEK